jgi:two-component system, sensor histidine kinase RpfC
MLSSLKKFRNSLSAEQEILGNRALLGAFACLVSFSIAPDMFVPIISVIYLSTNMLLYWLQSRDIGKYNIRVFITLILDALIAYTLLASNAEAMSFIYPLFLWMILGVGFRLGIPWLFLAATCSTIAFGSAVATTAYWQHNIILGYALTAGLFLVPAYCTKFIEGLSRAKEQAEVANRAKSYFLASVSHELRTPLNTIIGYGNHMNGMDLPSNQRDMVSASVKAGEHLLYLIDQLIQVGKSDIGKSAILNTKFKITDIIAETRSIMSVNAAEKNLVINIHAAPMSDQLLEGPTDIIRVLLVNLIGNAIKFTDSGSVSITAAIEKSETGNRLCIEVSDTGIGIATPAHSAIFEPFQQADETVLDRFGGTGLGLTICKQMLDQIDGSITLKSEIGEGSTFRVELPNIKIISPDNVTTNSIVRLIAFGEFENNVLAAIHAAGNFEILHKPCSDYIGLCTQIKNAELSSFDAVLIAEALIRGVSSNDNVWSEFTDAELAAVLVRDGSDLDLEDFAIRSVFATIIPVGHNFDELRSAIRIGCSFRNQQRFESNPKPVELAPSPSISRNILVADDNRTNRNVLAAILEAAGHIVEMVDDGDTALDALEKGGHDILLLDVNMPRLNGIDACRMWRKIEDGKSHLPIVGVTADATPDTENACISAGMDTRLTKPINAKILLETIQRYCPPKQQLANIPSYAPCDVIVMKNKIDNSTELALDADQIDYLHKIGDNQFVITMIEGFFEDAQELIQSMRDAAKDSDVAQFRFCVHGLKSSGNNIGALNLAKLGDEIERITEAEYISDGANYLALIETELAKLRIELNYELDRCQNSVKLQTKIG